MTTETYYSTKDSDAFFRCVELPETTKWFIWDGDRWKRIYGKPDTQLVKAP